MMLSLIELNPYVCFVKGDSPYRSAADLIAAIRASPGKLNFSTAGVGTSQNMAAQYFMTRRRGHFRRARRAGRVRLQQCADGDSAVKAGALRALFVTPARLTDMPDVPSGTEAGFPDMNKIVGWTALMGPPGLPKEVVDKWTQVFARLAADADWQQGNARIGGIAAIRSPPDTERFVREQYELYDKLIGTLGIRQ